MTNPALEVQILVLHQLHREPDPFCRLCKENLIVSDDLEAELEAEEIPNNSDAYEDYKSSEIQALNSR